MFDIRNITEDEAKKQLEYLAKEIEKADIAYYQNDAPSDAFFGGYFQRRRTQRLYYEH